MSTLSPELVRSEVRQSSTAPIELAVVIPTFNERQSVPLLLERLRSTLDGIAWEAIFVDDHSPDGTADYLRSIALTNPRIHVIERIGRRGLSSACIEGMMATAAPYVAVMDADLQHDESVLPLMFERIRSESLDVVVASRKMDGGSMGEFAHSRVRLSNLGSNVSKLICQCHVTDPMSGFFVVESAFFRRTTGRLTGTGFKILLDILASSKTPPRLGEVPYHFRTRQLGESKLDVNVQLEYLYLVVDKMIGAFVPTRFVLFVLVGSLGVLVHLGVLAAVYLAHREHFALAQAIATLAAMTFNFLLNNVVTFRDRRLRGAKLVHGLLLFYLACSFGAMINVSFASMLVRSGIVWYLAGVSGTIISSVWNYWVNAVLTWRRKLPS
jgi:dolichol-phosphate mannosyltransferase